MQSEILTDKLKSGAYFVWVHISNSEFADYSAPKVDVR